MRLLLTIALLSLSSFLFSQSDWDNLVSWEASYNAETSSVELEATMQKNWVIYSQHTPPDGPIPLEIEFEKAEGVEFVGKVEELDKPIKEVSKMFDMEVIKFKDSASFRQAIKLSSDAAVIKGTVTFMTCDNEKCLPPKTVPFEVKI